MTAKDKDIHREDDHEVDMQEESLQPENNESKEQGGTDEAVKELEEKLEKAENEAKDSYDRMLRVSAEFENYKKRNAREMNEFRKFANETLIKELLTVLDNLERAISSSNGDNAIESSIVEGVNLTIKDILKIFEKFSVTPIVAVEKPFDPEFHEAVYQEESDEFPENTVIKELQKGYMMHERLLRPSLVAVSKPKSN